ncbi:MAG: type II secretion system F family protein [Firmicutes bacterium]|nr:type II secretion system F family protein [Bacillota bacterium]
MAKEFSYEARDKTGKRVAGSVSAANKYEALLELRRSGLVIANLSEGKATKTTTFWEFLQQPVLGTSKLQPGQLSSVLRQLANLLSAGVPIDRSLKLLLRVPKDQKTKDFIQGAHRNVTQGNSLSAAWGGYRGFPKYGFSMLKAGETSGNLEDALLRIADVIDRNIELRSLISSSLAYPLFLFLVSVTVVVLLLIYAVPQFLDIFTLWGGELPRSTMLLIKASETLKLWGPFGLGIMVIGVISIFVWRSTASGRLAWDTLLLRLPLFGNIIRDTDSARLFRTVSGMLHAGVALPVALRLGAGAAGNLRLENSLVTCARKVETGASLFAALKHENVFPETIVELIAMGEEAGDLASAIDQGAQLLESETRQKVKNLTTMLEPAMILFMALVVGFVVISILLPVVTIMNMPM